MPKPHSKQSREAAKLIAAAQRPVLYVGGGVNRARAWAQLAELVEITGIPVVTTLMARGAIPDSHELNLGMPGMHGTVAGSYTHLRAHKNELDSVCRLLLQKKKKITTNNSR